MTKRKEKSKVLEVAAVPTHESLNYRWFEINNGDIKGQLLIQKAVGPVDRIIIVFRIC